MALPFLWVSGIKEAYKGLLNGNILEGVKDAWNPIFLRDSERKEIWCDMACLRIYQFATGCLRCLDASPNIKMNRLAEMSCSRYWIERALEDAKGKVRGWLGWHHHMTMVLLAMQVKWKDKAPMLTIQDVREILEVLGIVKRKHKARESARKSHHKRKSKPN